MTHTLRPYPLPSEIVDQLQQLLRARRGLAQALTSLQQRRAPLPRAASYLDAAMAGLRGQLEALDEEIAVLVADQEAFPTVAKLDAVPGIATLTAATVAACLHARQFQRPDQFVAYIGLDLRVRDSGQQRGRRTLSHQGDAEVRRVLYLAAQANIRCKHSPFREQYERECAKGLTGTQALCAVARKLARVCWSLVKHDATYDPARVHQQPPKKATSQPVSA